ncbi:MAG: anthranilate synthase component I family protein, partial [Deltaproteobacteria bacterium]|nr:anthranilate synthase component I family protein [Deltaproteobacteria bacterium]
GPSGNRERFRVGPLKAGFSKRRFESAVETAREFIQNGEAIQIVLSRKLSGEASGDDTAFYEELRSVNPSPYLFHLAFGETRVIGASPEMLVRLEGRKITYKPIAGTRPRGRTRREELRLEAELRTDPKERAEHVMLVDLGRNDVGRVAEPGSVRVKRFMQVERYSHVVHLVSEIQGELEQGKDGLDLLMSVFPAGTVTGAPKVRAMEIIAGLEPSPRGSYAGALGCLGWNGDMDFCIPIRTAFLQGERIALQAGAGIVFDSVPEREFLETRHKMEALLRAVQRSEA